MLFSYLTFYSKNVSYKQKISILLFVCLLYTSFSSLQAKIPTASSLLNEMVQKNEPVSSQLFLRTKVIVYQQTHTQEKQEIYLSQKGFTQQIVWIRNRFLSIQNYSLQNKKTSVFLRRYQKQFISKASPFQVEDSLYHYLFFLQIDKQKLIRTLSSFGISSDKVQIVLYDGEYSYKLGFDDQYIIVDTNTLHVKALVRSLVLNGQTYEYKITFDQWKRYLPKETKYYLNNDLIKKVMLVSYTKRRVQNRMYNFLQKYSKNLIKIQ